MFHSVLAGKEIPFAQERFFLFSDSLAARLYVSNLRVVLCAAALEASVSGVFLFCHPPFCSSSVFIPRVVLSELRVGSLDYVFEVFIQPNRESAMRAALLH